MEKSLKFDLKFKKKVPKNSDFERFSAVFDKYWVNLLA